MKYPGIDGVPVEFEPLGGLPVYKTVADGVYLHTAGFDGNKNELAGIVETDAIHEFERDMHTGPGGQVITELAIQLAIETGL